MKNQNEIHWQQAKIVSQRTIAEKSERFEHIKKEIQDSNFDCLDGADIDYYAGELTHNALKFLRKVTTQNLKLYKMLFFIL